MTEAKNNVLSNFVKKYIMYIVLAVMIVFFSIVGKNFLSLSNFRNVLNQASYQVIVGVGIVFVLLSGAMDLSVGYQMSLVGAIVAVTNNTYGVHWMLAIVIGLLAGVIMSWFNGFVYAKLNVFPFIVTLATQYIFQGFAYMLTNAKTFNAFPDAFKVLGQGKIFGFFPVPILVMIICVAFGSFILNKTYFGRYVYGLGGNAEAVALAGVNVSRYKIVCFMISGFFVALGMIVLTSRSGAYNNAMGPGTEFTAISGGILGGIKLRGGEGKVSCIVVGTLILTILMNGMQLMQLGTYPQYVAKGLVLILALALDSLQTQRTIKKAKMVSGEPPQSEDAPAAANA